jgi:hypothetical protein
LFFCACWMNCGVIKCVSDLSLVFPILYQCSNIAISIYTDILSKSVHAFCAIFIVKHVIMKWKFKQQWSTILQQKHILCVLAYTCILYLLYFVFFHQLVNTYDDDRKAEAYCIYCRVDPWKWDWTLILTPKKYIKNIEMMKTTHSIHHFYRLDIFNII